MRLWNGASESFWLELCLWPSHTNIRPSKSSVLCNRMRVKPKMMQDFRLVSVLLMPFLGEDFPKMVFFPTPPPPKKNVRHRATLTSSCYMRVDENVDPKKSRSFKKILWMFRWPCNGSLKLTKCHSLDVFHTTVHRFHRCKNWKAKKLDAPFASKGGFQCKWRVFKRKLQTWLLLDHFFSSQ